MNVGLVGSMNVGYDWVVNVNAKMTKTRGKNLNRRNKHMVNTCVDDMRMEVS